jgi:hypothetical protein
MKKIITAAILLLLLLLGTASCVRYPAAAPAADTATEPVTPAKAGLSARTFWYDGHSYVVFYTHYSTAVIHDPDCPCGAGAEAVPEHEAQFKPLNPVTKIEPYVMKEYKPLF